MKPYRFLLRDEVAVEFGNRSKADREILLRRFCFLASYPEQAAEERYNGEHGEEIRRHRFGRWRITYRVDSPVREVHIPEIKKLSA